MPFATAAVMRNSMLTAAAVFIGSLLLHLPDARAMPMFARKYHMPCSGCHEPTIPRLNDVGYLFRRAGFRMPEQIGQEELSEFTFGDYFSGRIQTRATVSHTSDERTAETTKSTSNGVEMREITLYPITGSFMKHWATLTEISLAPDETPELENAYVRGVWGTQDLWFEARAGLFHPFEGFGAADRPIGVSRPLFETTGANQNQDTLFRIWGIDQVGAEAGVQWMNTSLSASVVNGLNTEVEGGKVVGVGITPDGNNGKDFLITANHILGAQSGVFGYYAHGTVELPVDVAGFIDGTATDTFNDRYDRLALFGSYGIQRFTALAGAESGWDHARDMTTGARSRFRSQGAFVEGTFSIDEHTAAWLRLDYFDPSSDKSDNELLGAAVGTTFYYDWVSLYPELQLRDTQGAMGDKVDTTVILHAIAIY